MRYFSIKLDKQGAPPPPKIFPVFPNAWDAGSHWTSATRDALSGAMRYLPGAQHVDLDLPVWAYGESGSTAAMITIYGVSKYQVGQAAQLGPSLLSTHPERALGYDITVRGGFMKGLPLANLAAAHAGILFQGTIVEAVGNWTGPLQSLTLLCAGLLSNPLPGEATIELHWPAGMPLANAISGALQTAFPAMTVQTSISPDLVLARPIDHRVSTLTAFAQFVEEVSHSINKSTAYPGVSISQAGKVIVVTDGTQASSQNPKIVDVKELVGLPTWTSAGRLSFTTMMRSGLNIGDTVKFSKPGFANVIPGANTGAVRDDLTFSGNFWVSGVRHLGSFTSPDAMSWVTVFDATPSGFADAALPP